MWTEFKDDVPENEKTIWVMLLDIDYHMSLRTLFHWNEWIKSLYLGRVLNVPNVLEKAKEMAFQLVIKLGCGLCHRVEVGFNFFQGLLNGVYSDADFYHDFCKGHYLFFPQFLETFGHINLQFGHHQEKFIRDCGCCRLARWQ
eukprot:2999443-Ditylum_brightwellii.AAC.1